MTAPSRITRNGNGRHVQPVVPVLEPTALPLNEIVDPHSSASRPEHWPDDPQWWEGSGSHDVTVQLSAPGAGDYSAVTLTLRRLCLDEPTLWLDIEASGMHDPCGSMSIRDLGKTIELTPKGLLVLAEALRRIIPLARANGLIPLQPE